MRPQQDPLASLVGHIPTAVLQSPKFINSYSKAVNYNPNPQPVQQVKKGGRGGFLSSLISELGGAGGAAGGAAIGTALAPGIGTLLGAGLGGFFGGTGGRVVENQVRDSRLGIGDALKEGGLAGALSLGGEAFQLARGAKAAKGVGAVLGEDVGRTAPATVRLGALENKGLGLTSKAGGYFVGAEVPGTKALTPSRVKYYDDLLRKLKIPANDSADLAKGIENRLATVGSRLEGNVAKNNVAVDTEQLAKDLISKVKTTPGLSSKANIKFAEDQASLLKNLESKDTAGILKFRREMDSFINQNANPDSALAGQQGVARIFRGGVKDKLNSQLPGFAKENNLFHDLSDIQSYVLRASKRTGMESTSGGGGLSGRLLSSPTANTAKAKLGSKLQTVGEFSAGTGGPLTQVTANLRRQSPASLIRAISGGLPTNNPQQDSMQQTPLDETGGLGATNELGIDTGTPQQPQQSLYSLEQALSDVQRDPKNTDKYLNVYKTVAAADKSSAGVGPNITKVTSQQYSLAKRGAQSLQQLQQLLQNNPDVLSRTRTPGRKLPIVGGYVSKAVGTGEYDAIGYNIANALLRLETGAQANESEIRNLQTQLMPRAGDSSATVQRKLQQLQQAFGVTLNAAQGGASSSTSDLYGALAQGGY